MEAATKNKRGRPKTVIGILSDDLMYSHNLAKRTAVNSYYACQAVLKLGYGQNGSFFLTDYRKVRRQGIAEQLGRMLEDGFSVEDCKELAETCIKEYQAGVPCKKIEQRLRDVRQLYK